MNAIVPVLLAAGFAAVTHSAFGVDLTAEDRTELRARAERLQTERVQSPLRAAADTVPLDRPQGDVRFRDSGDVKPGKRSAEVKPHQNRIVKKATDRKKSKRAKRSLRDLPGAFVRR